MGQQCLGEEARAEREEERVVGSGAIQGDEVEETGTCSHALHNGSQEEITDHEWFTLCSEKADSRVHRLGLRLERSKRKSRLQQSSDTSSVLVPLWRCSKLKGFSLESQ